MDGSSNNAYELGQSIGDAIRKCDCLALGHFNCCWRSVRCSSGMVHLDHDED